MVLPGMKQRRRGYIVNISSGSGVLPSCPLLSIYAATKAYVDCFSRAVDAEYGRYGIHVQSQTPFFIATKLAKIRRTSLTVPSTSAFVAAGMRWIGQAPSCNPFYMHDILQRVMSMLPYSMAAGRVRERGVVCEGVVWRVVWRGCVWIMHNKNIYRCSKCTNECARHTFARLLHSKAAKRSLNCLFIS